MHLLIKVMDGYGMYFCFAVLVSFGLIGLLEGNKIIVFLDSLILFDGKLSDVNLRVNINFDLVSFKFFG